MSTRHNPLTDIFDVKLWPITDTRSHKQTWKSYAPGQPVAAEYSVDCTKFAELRENRHSFIRPSNSHIEPLPTGWDCTGVPQLPIWVVIIRIAPGWHFELPFFRGPKPYTVEPSTDAEVAAVVSECIAIGGYNEKALQEWRSAVVAKK